MNEIKAKRINEQRKVLSIILLTSAVVLLGLFFLLNDKDAKFIFLTLSGGMAIAFVFARFVNPNFGYKPTLEEIEEEQFGNKTKK